MTGFRAFLGIAVIVLIVGYINTKMIPKLGTSSVTGAMRSKATTVPDAQLLSVLHAANEAITSHPNQKVVFLTGAAGFIGMNTAKKLSKQGDVVVGIDNFNPYYDVRIKQNRARQLAALKAPIFMITGDLCDEQLLEIILSTVKFTHVIHLAAQAGVRYSIKQPQAYIRANVQCMVSLLESLQKTKNTKRVSYASSSSVYGLNTKIPFSEEDDVTHQASLYGATKIADERIAHVYKHLYKFQMIGLRFFTVYGPMGRPDMAYWIFTEKILKNETMTVYRKNDGGELMRDFTFVSDIVDGVVATLELDVENEVFNLGNNRPNPVSKLISLLEEGIGCRAQIQLKPISEGDVPMTYANISKAQRMLDYSPKVTLDEGIAHFLDWYAAAYNFKFPLSPDECNVVHKLVYSE